MSSLLALILFAAAPEAAAASAPAPQARVVGIARARIVAPVRLSLVAAGTVAADTNTRLVTHHQPRRDGAQVVDCY
jgi:hypothetical protein